MQKIKAVLFDFDGVLTMDATGSATITNYISDACAIPAEQVRKSYYRFNKRLLFGEITHREMWEEFCADLGQKTDYAVLIDSFRHTRLDERMLELVRRLKERYFIGMVTDNKCDRIQTILEYRNLDRYFDVVAVSAQVHSGKESSEIFEYVLDALKVKADECVFIDNSRKNLIIPEQMGMATVYYDDQVRNFDDLTAELMKIIS